MPMRSRVKTDKKWNDNTQSKSRTKKSHIDTYQYLQLVESSVVIIYKIFVVFDVL